MFDEKSLSRRTPSHRANFSASRFSAPAPLCCWLSYRFGVFGFSFGWPDFEAVAAEHRGDGRLGEGALAQVWPYA